MAMIEWYADCRMIFPRPLIASRLFKDYRNEGVIKQHCKDGVNTVSGEYSTVWMPLPSPG